MPDRDEFSRATQLGQAVACALHEAVEGKEFDRFTAAKLISRAIESCGGIPVLPPLLDAWKSEDSNLPLRFDPLDDAAERLDAIDRALREHGKTALDQMLARTFQRAALDANGSARKAVERFLCDLVLRFAVEGKGGLKHQWGAERIYRLQPQIEAFITPVAKEGAALLLKRPEAMRLRQLPRMYRAEVDPHANLL